VQISPWLSKGLICPNFFSFFFLFSFFLFYSFFLKQEKARKDKTSCFFEVTGPPWLACSLSSELKLTVWWVFVFWLVGIGLGPRRCWESSTKTDGEQQPLQTQLDQHVLPGLIAQWRR
jgi:hypothetical protein